MSKNKLKFVIFSVLFLIFSITRINEVSANEYNVSVTSIDGLVYGNKLKEGTIEGNSDIPGYFSFYNQDRVLDTIGNIEVEVGFTPYDLNNYSSKKLTVNSNVSKRRISVVFETPLYKKYDGTDSLNIEEYSYSGIINNEVSITGELKAKLNATYVGEGIGVTLSGVEIEGEKKDYYYIDLLEHEARIYPSFLEKIGDNHTIITLDEDVYVDIDYNLKLEIKDVEDVIENKYTSFYLVNYNVYNNHDEKIDVTGKYRISMKIDESIMRKERLHVFELTSKGEYKEIEYSYDNETLSFVMNSDSSLVFATRNIEYGLIIGFSCILLFYLGFVIVYRVKNSKMKGKSKY